MKPLFFILLIALPHFVLANEVDFDQLCLNAETLNLNPDDPSADKIFAIIQDTKEGAQLYDNGLCNAFKYSDKKRKQVQDVKWRLRFYASHSFTTYFSTDIKIRSSYFNVEIEDYEIVERSSREFFTPKVWKQDGHNPFQLLDEPTNTFILNFEKDKNEVFISYFHPKFLQDNYQIAKIKGQIAGINVDQESSISAYSSEPANMRLVRNANTYMQVEFTAGYGRRFDLLANSKWGTLSVTPSIALGLMTGKTNSVVRDQVTGDLIYYIDPYKIQGFGGSIKTRLDWRTPRERFGLFYEMKYSLFSQNHGILDGRQTYYLKYGSNNFGLSFNIYSRKEIKIPTFSK